MPALIPEDYLPDVHTRLVLYKRIASASNEAELSELKVEMIDRFGLLPDPVKRLFAVTGLKLKATPLGIRKIEVGPKGGRVLFGPEPHIDVSKMIGLIQRQPKTYKLDGQDRLRISKPMEQPEQRIAEIEHLLTAVAA